MRTAVLSKVEQPAFAWGTPRSKKHSLCLWDTACVKHLLRDAVSIAGRGHCLLFQLLCWPLMLDVGALSVQAPGSSQPLRC